ncbi:MAG: hypothetical protein FWC80_06520, partial [Firmicutes bacterium]|nr:hypothetical protein [Bacillota bacterium]
EIVESEDYDYVANQELLPTTSNDLPIATKCELPAVKITEVVQGKTSQSPRLRQRYCRMVA